MPQKFHAAKISCFKVIGGFMQIMLDHAKTVKFNPKVYIPSKFETELHFLNKTLSKAAQDNCVLFYTDVTICSLASISMLSRLR